MQSRLVSTLIQVGKYPHAVGPISLIETHISWVILTGSYAYKLKKPVDFGFLDFSSLEKRKHFCEEELRLNKRFSESLYIDVVTITGSPDSPQVDGTGEIIDYAVKMKQFSQRCLLQACISRGEITTAQIDILGVKLAHFHHRADKSIASHQGNPPYGSAQAVRLPVLENFEQMRPMLQRVESIHSLQNLQQWTQRTLLDLEDLFIERKKSGFIRECHGDLHLGNIVVLNNEITFFDCIEFNDQLRWIDTFSELTFLIMDLEDKGYKQWANRLLNTYLECTGDYQGLQLLPFYKVYRAVVRAKINLLRFGQEDLSDAERDQSRLAFNHYTNLAQGYTQIRQPLLVMMHGVSGSGKSTVAAAVAAEFDAIRVRSDVERKRLFGIKPYDSSKSAHGGNIYTKAATDKTFARLAEIVERLLKLSYPVVVDATFLTTHHRDGFRLLAQNHRIPFVILDCQASEKTLLQRLNKRREEMGTQFTNEASEAGTEVMRSQLHHQQSFTDEEKPYVLTVNTDEGLNITEIIDHLQMKF